MEHPSHRWPDRISPQLLTYHPNAGMGKQKRSCVETMTRQNSRSICPNPSGNPSLAPRFAIKQWEASKPQGEPQSSNMEPKGPERFGGAFLRPWIPCGLGSPAQKCPCIHWKDEIGFPRHVLVFLPIMFQKMLLTIIPVTSRRHDVRPF